MEPSTRSDKGRLTASLRPVLLPAFAFSCLINLLAGTGPLFMLQVIDRVLPTGSTSTLIALILIATIALAVMAVLDALRAVLMARAAAWWELDTTRRLVPGTIGGSLSASEASGHISTVSGFVGGPALQALFDAPWAFIFLLIVLLLHPYLALLGLCIATALILLTVAGHWLGKAPQTRFAEARRQSQGMIGHLDRNADLVATMGLAGNLFEKQSSMFRDTKSLHLDVVEPEQKRRAAAKFVRAISQILVLGLGAWLVLSGQLSGGAMIAASILMSRTMAPIEQITGSLSALIEARAALDTLNQQDRRAGEKSENPELADLGGALSCENLSVVAGPGEAPRLHQISFQIEAGKCLAIMGPSGSGKSTLAAMIAGAADPTIGSVRLDGFEIRNLAETQRARTIGYLPQSPVLFPGTISENIARFQPNADHGEVVRAAMAAGVHGLISHLPDGYETQIGFETGPLSGGARQRIALARALFDRPSVLVLDEPNAALDKEGERALISSIARLKTEGVTIILVAHRAGVLSLVDRILLLDSGRVRDSGPKGEVMARMNARMMQIDLKRDPSELPRLEDWIGSHFKRDTDGDARANAAMVATEMFNISLNSPPRTDETSPIRFTLKHSPGICAISLHDTCELIASTRLDRLRRIAGDDMLLAPAMEGADLALLMVMQLSESFEQRAAEYGRVMKADIVTPMHDQDGEAGSAPADRLLN
ncbi:MAG: ATP-binding cassette domain-containing protein [Pseudomonadota bacterium]